MTRTAEAGAADQHTLHDWEGPPGFWVPVVGRGWRVTLADEEAVHGAGWTAGVDAGRSDWSKQQS
jgi:hypothetical protein